jgi:soluble lytic murein transglycosylase-like protein
MPALRRSLLAALNLAIAACINMAQAEPAPPSPQGSMCLMMESAARAHDLPLEFFVRVIWRESRFEGSAVGPVTRSGKRAQGIAQFMPYTAEERGLLDPFDPIQALPKAAEFLSELRGDFGNLGLAAAAYNAGPRRVREWLAGTGPMPVETRAYVLAITGRTVEDWASAQAKTGDDKTPDDKTADNKPDDNKSGGNKGDAGKPADCNELVASLRAGGANRYVAALEQRVSHAAGQPWGVQLAAGFSRDHALASYASIVGRLASVVGEHDPIISSLILRSRGTRPFYKVSIGADTRGEADALCNRIRSNRGACFVQLNRS